MNAIATSPVLGTRNLRTLQLGDDWFEDRPGGLSRYFYELLQHLPAAHASVEGLVLGSERLHASTNGAVTAFAAAGDPIWKRLSGARKSALAAMRERPVDVIAAHFALYALPLLDQFRATPLVMHFHGPWAAESDAEQAAGYNSRMKHLIEKLVYTRARRFVVLSKSFQQEIITRYGVDEEKVRVVPGGIDTTRFNSAQTRNMARQQLHWPTDRPIVLTVRRQVRRVGLEHFIDAAKLVLQTEPDALFLFGGSGPLANELRERIASFGLQESIRLLGRIEEVDLPTAYRAADLSVVPSQSLEGFGLTALESLAAGTPVYVTPVGGLPETVQPFAPQCVFADPSVEAIADGLRSALDGSCPPPSAEVCRSYAVQNYSWVKIAERVRAVYAEAAA
jgi:glycogen(starch) synthase